jgi:hypothetical protein
MGPDGRQELLKQAANAQDIDTDRILPEGKKTPQQFSQQNGPVASAPLPAPASLDEAGNKTQGEDMRLISHEQAPQMRA